MSVTTSKRFNRDSFTGLLPVRAAYSATGAAFEAAAEKTISGDNGLTDAQITTAVDGAAAVFVDYDQNRDQILTRLAARLTDLQAARVAITANPPTVFVNATNQERVLLRNLINSDIGLIRLVLQSLESPD